MCVCGADDVVGAVDRILDLSFNTVRKIERLDALVLVQRLFLCQNKISVIENLAPLVNITLLELGANRIRVRSERVRKSESE